MKIEIMNIGDSVVVDVTDYLTFPQEFRNFLSNTEGEIVDMDDSLSGCWYQVKFDISGLDRNLIDDVRNKYDDDTNYQFVDLGENVFEFLSSDII